MKLFRKKNKKAKGASRDLSIGVDFGTRSIKLVALHKGKNGPVLAGYGSVLLNQTVETNDQFAPDHAVLVRSALRALLQKMNYTQGKVSVGIPGFNGLVMMVDFPQMSEEDLAQAIQFESRKYIPASLDDVNVSWEIIDDTEDVEEGAMRVLLIAAPRGEIEYYESLFVDMPLQVERLELETFALERVFVGEQPGKYMIIEIGAKTANLILVENSVVHINRSIDVGGVDFTTTIAENLNLSEERARSYKEEGRDFLTGPSKMQFPAIDYIHAEINRILAARKSDELDRIILAGGGAHLMGLDRALAELTGLQVVLANPWEQLQSQKISHEDLMQKAGSQFAVAIGLALGNAE